MKMSDAIIVALITGVCAVVAQFIINRKSQSDLYSKLDKSSELSDAKLDAKLEKHQAVTDTKIEELVREVREHNNFARRIPLVEKDVQVLGEKVARLEQYHRPT